MIVHPVAAFALVICFASVLCNGIELTNIRVFFDWLDYDRGNLLSDKTNQYPS